MPRAAALVAEIAAREGVRVVQAPGAWFFYHDPEGDLDLAKHHPFATIVTSDAFDGASDLERRGAFRVNLGLRMASYRARFGDPPGWGAGEMGIVATGHDFTAADALMPHPQYAPMGWVCIVDPSDASWEALRPLLEEAHEEARRRWRARKKG